MTASANVANATPRKVAPGHKTPGRRILEFTSVDQIMPDVDQLLAGHHTVGQWSLGQICHHLSFAAIACIEGFPTRPFPRVLRATAGRLILRQMLNSGRIPEGVWLPKDIKPKPGLDARAEAEALRAALTLYQAEPAPRAVHPFFGSMTRAQWDRYHCVHCAHHLSFAVPTEPGEPSHAG